MPPRRSALLVGSLVLATTASAAVPRGGTRIVADELTAMPSAGVAKPLRSQRMVKHEHRSTRAWQRFAAAAGGTWSASWDAATSVPNRIWGSGIPAPGAMASPVIAERIARRVLADHLALLAPGAAPADFVLVANHSDGEIRSIGFEQRAAGRRVLGGQISFRFKADRLFLIGSEALPDVKLAPIRSKLARGTLASRATDNLRRELALPGAPVSAPATDEVILPLVAEDGVLGYRLATSVTLDGGYDGRYLAYVDPGTGAVLAVRQMNTYATGTVLYRSVNRYPGRGRLDKPAPRVQVKFESGSVVTTGADGTMSWTPDAPQTVTTGVLGDHVTIVNKGEGALAQAQLPISPGGQLVWDASADPELDAQVVTFVAVNAVKAYVRTNIDATMPKLDEAITANVNLPQNCNAFFDGKAINFFHASPMCQNTGLIEDVIYHEFGHALHTAEIIQGVGSFDGAMSEGAADFLAASMTGDSGMGRGFFYDDKPLRELDPTNSEFTWPKDISEIHHTGQIYGGAMWDLRKNLIAELGETAGIALTNKIFLGTMRRSVSIPSSMFEALATDDDDGNLSNGTPHECAIRDAYGRHGLRTATGVVAAPGALDGQSAATTVRIDISGLSARCQGDEIDKVTLAWKPGYTELPPSGEAQMTAVSATRFWATLPLAIDENVYYQARVQFKDGSVLTLPDNLADPHYQLYQGATVPLYCTTFEDGDPFAAGWTTGAGDDQTSQWQWGPAAGGGSDPPAAYSGTNFMGTAIGGDYSPTMTQYARLPDIDVGQWSDVRLQYRRWLAVEDSHFDQAKVLVNGKKAWINYTSDMGDSSAIHHIDREWRFHDVLVSGYAFGHILQIAFELTTDEGLNLGGWAIDDVCVVANIHSICGDGVKSPTEQCDDGPGNADRPDKCRTYCRLPACGDGIVDNPETCDEGPGGSKTCTPQCTDPTADDTGCCSASGGPSACGLALLLGALLRRRRR